MNDGLIASENSSPIIGRRFASQIGWTIVVRLLMTAVSVLAGIVVARWLGAESIGQLAVINVSVVILVQLGSAGLPSANTYFIAKDTKYLFTVALNSLLFTVVVGAVLAFGLTIMATTRPEWFGFVAPGLIGIAAMSIPFQLIGLIGLNIFLAVGDVKRFNLLDLAGQSFVLVNAIVALIILRSDLLTLVFLNAVASAGAGIVIASLVGKYGSKLRNGFASWRFDLRLLGRMVRYGMKFHVSILAAALIFRADLLVVNHFHGAAEAGIYSVAAQVATMLMLLPGVIATLLFPRLTVAEDTRGETTSRVTRITAFVMLFICLAAVPISFFLPAVYGPAFAGVSVQLLILLPGVYLIGVQSILAQYFNAIGLPPTIPALWLITLFAHVILLIVLVPSLGGRGAALASSLSYAMIFSLMLFYFKACTGKSAAAILLLSPYELRGVINLRKPQAS